MADDLTLERYIACLQRLHGIVVAWEDVAWKSASALTDSPWLHPLLAARRREVMLRRDLAFFHAAVLPTPVDATAVSLLPAMPNTASLLGAMYVMEGSTIGGQLIARHVERVLPLSQSLSDGLGSEFFRGHRDQTGPMWKEFCEILRTRIPEDQTDSVILAAKKMFAAFGVWMEHVRRQGRSTELEVVHPLGNL